MPDPNFSKYHSTNPDVSPPVFRIESDSLGQCRVWIDGIEQNRVRSVHFSAKASEVPTINLEFLGGP